MYYAKVNWWNEVKEEDVIEHVLIPATDWNSAMGKLTNQFENLNSIEMQELDRYSSIVYLPEQYINEVVEMNLP